MFVFWQGSEQIHSHESSAFSVGSRGPAPPLVKRSETGPEYFAKEMEKEVNGLLEKSAEAAVNSDFSTSLTKAKEAAKKERLVCLLVSCRGRRFTVLCCV